MGDKRYERQPARVWLKPGLKYGGLTVIGTAPIIPGRYVAFQCACGERFVDRASEVADQYGRPRSRRSYCRIGCPAEHDDRLARQEQQAEEWAARRAEIHQSDLGHRRIARALLRSLISTAKRRMLEVTLTEADLVRIRIVDPTCTYCKVELLTTTRAGVCLDRIDNDRGYHVDNVLACCPDCNLARGRLLSVEEFRAAMAYRLERLDFGEGPWDRKNWKTRSAHTLAGGLGRFAGPRTS